MESQPDTVSVRNSTTLRENEENSTAFFFCTQCQHFLPMASRSYRGWKCRKCVAAYQKAYRDKNKKLLQDRKKRYLRNCKLKLIRELMEKTK
jgi:hypothetical protein